MEGINKNSEHFNSLLKKIDRTREEQFQEP